MRVRACLVKLKSHSMQCHADCDACRGGMRRHEPVVARLCESQNDGYIEAMCKPCNELSCGGRTCKDFVGCTKCASGLVLNAAVVRPGAAAAQHCSRAVDREFHTAMLGWMPVLCSRHSSAARTTLVLPTLCLHSCCAQCRAAQGWGGQSHPQCAPSARLATSPHPSLSWRAESRVSWPRA